MDSTGQTSGMTGSRCILCSRTALLAGTSKAWGPVTFLSDVMNGVINFRYSVKRLKSRCV